MLGFDPKISAQPFLNRASGLLAAGFLFLTSACSVQVEVAKLPDPKVALREMPSMIRGDYAYAIDYQADVPSQKQIESLELQISVEGGEFQSLAKVEPGSGSYVWHSPAQDIKSAQLRIVAVDNRTNSSIADSNRFEIRNSDPFLTQNLAPKDKADRSRGITYGGDCEVGLAVQIDRMSTVQGGSVSSKVDCMPLPNALNATGRPLGSWRFVESVAGDGDYSYFFRQIDTVGHVTTLGARFLSDATPPAVTKTLVSGQSSLITASPNWPVSFDANDALTHVVGFCFKAFPSSVSPSGVLLPSASDGCWTAAALPASLLQISNASFVAPYSTNGDYHLFVWAKDELGNVSELSAGGQGTLGADKALVTFRPQNDLQISPAAKILAVTNTAVFTASGGTAPYQFALSGGGTLNSNGVSATYTAPNAAGTATLTVTDALNYTSTAGITINPALEIVPATLAMTVNTSFRFGATGGVSPYSFSVLSGGGSFSGNNYLSLNNLGSVSVQVTDSYGNKSVATITINDVAPSNLAYSMNPAAYTKGVSIVANVPSNSGGKVTSYSISPALPAGLSFDAATGIISGTPTVIAPTAIYTVTASNSGGSTSVQLSITVKDVAPSALAYSMNPSVYTKGTAIAPNSPSSSGGPVVSYSVNPPLPSGLSLNPSSGVISGTPTAISPLSAYVVTAVNSGGSTSVQLSITVNDVAPSSLAYSMNPAVYTKGVAIMPNAPSNAGGAVVSYAISPALPAGLSFNSSTGVISGTPNVISPASVYAITATNSGGSASVQLNLTVNDAAPSNLAYSDNPAIYTKGVLIKSNVPTWMGGAPTSFSVSPSLPVGLSLNGTTGVISGTPLVLASSTTYTVTATNSGGSVSAGVVLAVNDQPPMNLSYSMNPAVYTKGVMITPNTPSSSGGAILSYSISPSLPAGLGFNTSTGVISGTPSAISAGSIYTVTANTSGGSASVQLSITVNDAAPTNLAYAVNPAVYTKGTMIAANSPRSSGGAVISYSVSPNLPTGLNLNPSTGAISGTPTVVSAASVYAVTASNSGGSASVALTITVKDVAPSSLSYTLNPAVYTKGVAIAPNAPRSSGGAVVSYAASPSLPPGLTLNSSTGVISGTPSSIGNYSFTITATNSGGSVSVALQVTINDLAPSTLSYSSNPAVYTKGVMITPNMPSYTGGAVISYSVFPTLPAGLSLNSTSGVISGTPTAVVASASYTVTAANSGGSASVAVSITVKDVAPASLSYSSNPAIYTKGVMITPNTPTFTGGRVTSFSVSPMLPAGLVLNTSTGVITGTPVSVSGNAMYAVTATNSGGSASVGLQIAVNDVAPSGLAYSVNPAVYTQGSSIAPNLFSYSGGAPTNISVSPALPAGLIFSSSTGTISGTPSVAAAQRTYTVTASNSGGSASVGLVLTVNPAPVVCNVAISPSAVNVSVGGTQQFSASGGNGSYSYSVLTSGGGSVSNTGLYSAPASSTGSMSVIVRVASGTCTADANVTVDPGLLGGHFDIETSIGADAFYPNSLSDPIDKHVHEYDDIYNVTGPDFFKLLASGLKQINQRIATNQRFYLIVSNAELSNEASIIVNGQTFQVKPYQDNVRSFFAGTGGTLPVYTLGTPTGTDTKLTSLKVDFMLNAILDGGLIGTLPMCVIANVAGQNGEYRNGALTIQAISADANEFDPALGVAKMNGSAPNGLLWEATLYYHNPNMSKCYGGASKP